MLTTTTAEKNSLMLQNESLLGNGSEQCAAPARRKVSPFNLTLKSLFLYASVAGLILVSFGLVLALKSQNVLMIECFKALLIIGILNVIRLFSKS